MSKLIFYPHTGNNNEICGGGNGLTVYQSSVTTGPSDLPSYKNWTPAGCFVDSVSNRVLPIATDATDSAVMTIEKCLDACSSLGYAYAGLEWSQECYCGSALPPVPATDGRCDMTCNGMFFVVCTTAYFLMTFIFRQPSRDLRRWKRYQRLHHCRPFQHYYRHHVH